ncbi:MAG: endopeptidase La [Flavobacteriaceae bacterium]|jgi:ATP-dependent Lon protease|nr:endopeptidase La [Flavobacteriaceae bacterium]|tara:strand:+ start:1022 stop:3472 length:2451 start_codon:yes stop_codon:yes gene_type:complete
MFQKNILSPGSLLPQDLEDEADLIPLMTSDDEQAMLKEPLPEELPILPLKNTVLFPGVVIPITASRDRSVKLIKEVNKGSKILGVIAQQNGDTKSPSPKDLFQKGTLAKVLRVLKMPDGNTTVILQGKKRFETTAYTREHPFLKAEIKGLNEVRPEEGDPNFDAIIESIRDLALKIISQNPEIPTEASFAIKNIQSNTFLVNFVSSNMNMSVAEKQEIMEIDQLEKRAMLCLKKMNIEYQKLSLKNDIQSKVRTDLDQQQREYFLHQQMKTIQEELGDVSYDQELHEMRDRAKTKSWNDKVATHFKKELAKLERMNPQVAEYSVQRNYLDLYLDLPWNTYSEDSFDLDRAQKILDRDHFGLDKVKQRIIEHLAVLKLRKDMKSPIICLVGPPGVGKTSLGKSVAEALGRKYVRMSLGGMRDEAEIRGHRKTYIGAMPGRLVQNIKKASTSNPVFVLDELDKLAESAHGDPSSAMLEVLDPEQNTNFYDNYLETGYDLSKVMFIATANGLSSIQPALRDRMEIIEVTGYTIDEKVQIGLRYLLPKQLKENGLKNSAVKLPKATMQHIVAGYTRESGVRGLEKQIAKVVRHFAILEAKETPRASKLPTEELESIMGPAKMLRNTYENNNVAGVVTGLAWTSLGGDILFIESSISKGKGVLSITGNLGKVMKESATIALQYIKAHASELAIEEDFFSKYNFHIHVPEGATPKDGPSAGITMITSLVSSILKRKVKNRIAMTGEITLRGKVLPVGGIKEKILAAKRANIKEIILSEKNQTDINEINARYLKGLQFHFVTSIDEVLAIAITKQRASGTKKQ